MQQYRRALLEIQKKKTLSDAFLILFILFMLYLYFMVGFSRARIKCQDLLSEQKVLVSHEANGGGQVCTF